MTKKPDINDIVAAAIIVPLRMLSDLRTRHDRLRRTAENAMEWIDEKAPEGIREALRDVLRKEYLIDKEP